MTAAKRAIAAMTSPMRILVSANGRVRFVCRAAARNGGYSASIEQSPSVWTMNCASNQFLYSGCAWTAGASIRSM